MSFIKKFMLFSMPIAVGYGIMKGLTFEEEIIKDKKIPVDVNTKLTNSQMVGLMLKQNIESNRPAWDVRPLDLSKVSQDDLDAVVGNSAASASGATEETYRRKIQTRFK
jgi:hypothetical protein